MSEPNKETLDVHLKAYDLMELSLASATLREAIEQVRADLEVLDRETLLRVALAVTIESTWRFAPGVDRQRLRER